VLVSLAVFTPQGPKNQVRWHSAIFLLAGNVENELRLNLVNGIRFKNYFTGIGFDLKLSRIGSLYTGNYSPTCLYADGRYYFGKNKSFFVKLDQGINGIATELPSSEYERIHRKIGYFGEGGVGVKAKLGNEVYYSIAFSYAFRQTRYNREYYDFWRKAWNTERIRHSTVFFCHSLRT
jgi:hypothetical protein